MHEGVTRRRGNSAASGEQLPSPPFSHAPAALSSTSNEAGIDAHIHVRTHALSKNNSPDRALPSLFRSAHAFPFALSYLFRMGASLTVTHTAREREEDFKMAVMVDGARERGHTGKTVDGDDG